MRRKAQKKVQDNDNFEEKDDKVIAKQLVHLPPLILEGRRKPKLAENLMDKPLEPGEETVLEVTKTSLIAALFKQEPSQDQGQGRRAQAFNRDHDGLGD